MHRRWGIVRGEGLDARLLEQRVGRGGVATAATAQTSLNRNLGQPRHGFAALVSFVGSGRSAARAVGAWFRLSTSFSESASSFRRTSSNGAAILEKPVSDRGTLEDLSQSAESGSLSDRKLLILKAEISE
jgi:hypothetical protein